MSETMKGFIYHKKDKTNGFMFVEDLPKPNVKEGYVLVKVKAAGLNPVDYKLPSMPFMAKNGTGVGLDLAGVVEEIGEGVTEFAVGDRVFGVNNGSLSEYNLVSTRRITKIPDGLTFAEAGAMPTVYLSAYQGFTDNHFKKGYKTLVIGASGGAGLSGVHIAKALGAGEVVGICSGKNADFVLEQGGDKIIDYTKQDVVTEMGKNYFDFVYDTATASGGGENYFGSSKIVRKPKSKSDPGIGMHVGLNGPLLMWLRYFSGFEKSHEKLLLTKPVGKHMEAIAKLMVDESGGFNFKPIVQAEIPFSEKGVLEGFDLLKSRRTRGKVVITFEDNTVANAQT